MPDPLPIEVDSSAASWWAGRGALLLDVRSPEERARGAIPGSRSIPVSDLRARWTELPADRPVIVYCSAGSRSTRAAAFLRDQGLDAAALV
ncbi:MAG: rhodanese-like domain-containing protein, partial [Candidatus Dormiibacterota bacterium]